jgi:hypothetical protein
MFKIILNFIYFLYFCAKMDYKMTTVTPTKYRLMAKLPLPENTN